MITFYKSGEILEKKYLRALLRITGFVPDVCSSYQCIMLRLFASKKIIRPLVCGIRSTADSCFSIVENKSRKWRLFTFVHVLYLSLRQNSEIFESLFLTNLRILCNPTDGVLSDVLSHLSRRSGATVHMRACGCLFCCVIRSSKFGIVSRCRKRVMKAKLYHFLCYCISTVKTWKCFRAYIVRFRDIVVLRCRHSLVRPCRQADGKDRNVIIGGRKADKWCLHAVASLTKYSGLWWDLLGERSIQAVWRLALPICWNLFSESRVASDNYKAEP